MQAQCEASRLEKVDKTQTPAKVDKTQTPAKVDKTQTPAKVGKTQTPASPEPQSRKKDENAQPNLPLSRPKLATLRSTLSHDHEQRSHSNMQSLNSEKSTISMASSVSSIESLLSARRENAEEILLGLGFGAPRAGVSLPLTQADKDDCVDLLCRIPGRFFEQPSTAKGIDVRNMIEAREMSLIARQNSLLLALKHSANQFNLLGLGTRFLELTPKCESRQRSTKDDDGENIPANVVHVTPPIDAAEESTEEEEEEEEERSRFGEASPASLEIAHNLASHNDLGGWTSKHVSLLVPSMLTPGSTWRKLSCPEIYETTMKVDRLLNRSTSSHSDCDRASISLFDDHKMSLDAQHLNLPCRPCPSPTMDKILRLHLTTPLDHNVSMFYAIEETLIVAIQSLRLAMNLYRFFIMRRSQAGVQAVQSNQPDQAEAEDENTKSKLYKVLLDRERLIFENLYLDVLEVETMLYNTLFKLRHSCASDWSSCASVYHETMQKAIHKVEAIHLTITKLRSASEIE